MGGLGPHDAAGGTREAVCAVCTGTAHPGGERRARHAPCGRCGRCVHRVNTEVTRSSQQLQTKAGGFLVKTLNKLGTKGNFLSLMKGGWEGPTAAAPLPAGDGPSVPEARAGPGRPAKFHRDRGAGPGAGPGGCAAQGPGAKLAVFHSQKKSGKTKAAHSGTREQISRRRAGPARPRRRLLWGDVGDACTSVCGPEPPRCLPPHVGHRCSAASVGIPAACLGNKFTRRLGNSYGKAGDPGEPGQP